MNNNLTIISAGAGAGKTTRLSKEIIDAIKQNTAPEKIVATTFTKKAAEELIERIRFDLLKGGYAAEASRILDGYVGTMNSIFGRIIQEFALESGLSPVQNLLEESQALSLFNAIAYSSIEKYEGEYFASLHRMQLLGGDNSWEKFVLNVLHLARQNGLSSETVKECADYSWTEMQKWLPEQHPQSMQSSEQLYMALKTAKQTLPLVAKTKKTFDEIEKVKNFCASIARNGYLTWEEWAKAAKLNPGKEAKDEVEAIVSSASIHPQHSQLHEDLKACIEAVFYCAADAMDEYETQKKKLGIIDFTDQEYLALRLLNKDEFLPIIKERIESVFIDEFQDSSPLQIALNMKLMDIAKEVTWVGDIKQAIYGFRGTDPDLMKTAMAKLTGAKQDILSDSYRSRPRLVEFVNQLFVPIFEKTGTEAKFIKLNPKREDKAGQQVPLEIWNYTGAKNASQDVLSLAKGIIEVIKNKENYIIVDKESREPRKLMPKDIAILCRSNDECAKLALTLSEFGVQATIGGEGLLSTDEVIFTLAVYRYLLDKNDTLALAQIIHFSSDEYKNGDWLEKWLTASAEEKHLNVFADEPIVQSINAGRHQLFKMSPSEILDYAIMVAKVDDHVKRWGNGSQRIANTNQLRGLVAQYENGATTSGNVASASGLLFYLKEVESNSELNRIAESTNDQAVKILTYHKSKGLEWPFVILSSLNKTSTSSKKPPVFDSVLTLSTKGFDVTKPLEGRKLLYWPWPYGGQSSGLGLPDYVEGSEILTVRLQQLEEEHQRLLYVGMTRARDYLVLATRDFSKATWLVNQVDAEDKRIIGALKKDENNNVTLQVADEQFAVNYKTLDQNVEKLSDIQEEATYVATDVERKQFKAARFVPSTVEVKLEEVDVDLYTAPHPKQVVSIGNRLPIVGAPEMSELGLMVHSFLAADNPQYALEVRKQLAEKVRENYKLSALTTEDLIQASERLHQFIETHYSHNMNVFREYPIHLNVNGQKAMGWIDLLVELPDGWVIIDHKSFPGSEDKWVAKASSYLPQLQIYKEAIERATNKPVIEAHIHMPIVGQVVSFDKSSFQYIVEQLII